MRGSSWKEIAELIGIAAIVASLIFVGLQMKQSQDIAIAAQYHDRAALAVDNFNSEMENGNLRVWARLFGNVELGEDMSIEDRGRDSLRIAKYIVMLDNHYYQYQSGFLDDESWQTHISGFKNLTSRNPEIRYFVENRSIPARPAFWKIADEVMAEIDSVKRPVE